MQQVRIDFDNPGLPQSLGAVEGESQSRIFQAALYKSGAAYTAPAGAVYSIMYRGFGPQNQGWYDTIEDGAGKRAACTVSGNVVTCELARQALRVPGHLTVVLCVSDAKGYMLKSWPIMADVRNDGYEDTGEIEMYFNLSGLAGNYLTQLEKAMADAETIRNNLTSTSAQVKKDIDAKAAAALESIPESYTEIDRSVKQLRENIENGWLYSSTKNLVIREDGQTIVDGIKVEAGKYYEIFVKSDINANLIGARLGLGSNGNIELTSEQIFNGYRWIKQADVTSQNSRVYLISRNGNTSAKIRAYIIDIDEKKKSNGFVQMSDVSSLINSSSFFTASQFEYGTITQGVNDPYGSDDNTRIRLISIENHDFNIVIDTLGDFLIEANFYSNNVQSGNTSYVRHLEIKSGTSFRAAIKRNENKPFTIEEALSNITVSKTKLDIINEEVMKGISDDLLKRVYSAMHRYESDSINNTQDHYMTIVHVTDLHGYANALEFAYNLADKIGATAVLNTGDTVLYNSTDDVSFVKKIVDAHSTSYFPIIGNHDAFSLNNAKSKYDKFISEFALKSELNIADIGNYTSYYYKDFNKYKIRLIVVDQYENYDGTMNVGVSKVQIEWLISTLSNVPDNYFVIIADHIPEDEILKNENYGIFYQKDKQNSMETSGNKLTKIIEAYISRKSFSYVYESTGKNINAYTIPIDFTSAKGTFICWINGHEHRDTIGSLKSSENKQIVLNSVTSACYSNMKRPNGEDYPVYAEAGDIPRIKGTSTEYAFNIYVFDTENKRIKVVRIGSDLTYELKERKYMIIPFSK